MPLAFPSPEFKRWLLTRSPAEQLAIGSGFMPDLGRYGFPRKDPALVTLVQNHLLPGPSAIRVNIFIWPEAISIALARTRRIWFGIVEIAAGPASAPGRLLVALAWDSDPGPSLVAAERELIAIAAREFP